MRRERGTLLNEPLAWKAALARDRSADGKFVFAVKTTGVYCRPSCPARRPLRKNVRFFLSGNEAQEQGYRPCQRCAPHEQKPQPAEQAVAAAVRFIEQRLAERISLDRLAERIGYSKYHLQRMFVKEVGMSPMAYQKLRAGGKRRVTTERLTWAIGPSPVGQVLVAASERGICAVFVGADEPFLLGELAAAFPDAELARDDQTLAERLSAVLNAVAGKPLPRALALDLRGTVFQTRVWEALRRIPPGKTQSYSEVAAAIGAPTAVRAVAGACAANHVAVLVPCHRVIRGNGHLGGYRWGLECKRHLLDREAKSS